MGGIRSEGSSVPEITSQAQIVVLHFPYSNRDLLREQLNQLVCLTAEA
jgi:hypothetical protein